MAVLALSWLYSKLRGLYPAAFLTVELLSAFPIAAATVALFSLYYEGGTDKFLIILGIALALTALNVLIALLRAYPNMRPIRRWIDGERDSSSTRRAWVNAVGLPLELIKRDFLIPVVFLVMPVSVAAVIVIETSWLAFFPFFAGSMVALGYAAILHYLVLEAGMRPVLIDINREVSPRLATGVSAFSLRVRLMAALPLINVITGLVVAAISGGGGGGSSLGIDVLIAVAVATTISLELTVMLSKSIMRPIADLQRATEAIRKGDFSSAVPVTTGDELGELAASFNQMIDGLRERERLREAFGTYLDKEVAEYILSEGFSEEGVEVDVSILFCDVHDFTGFAADSDAHEVVQTLNAMFAVVVPIVENHGGHVDKFEGDGLMAIFGAPEGYRDHAERAVRAAIEMAAAVNSAENPFRIGVGVNSGRVVAGSIGGAGRLNFSVIGDAVNVAARTESATRQTGDDVLITDETYNRLSPDADIECVERGERQLKGLDRPLGLHAAIVPGREPAPTPTDGAGAGEQEPISVEGAAPPAPSAPVE